jgi:hypothetical protein
MACLALQGAWLVVRHAASELTIGNSSHAPEWHFPDRRRRSPAIAGRGCRWS